MSERINIDLLQRVMGRIEQAVIEQAVKNEPLRSESIFADRTKIDGWNQASWRSATINYDLERCHTTQCFAGWTVEVDSELNGTPGWLLTDEELIGVYWRSSYGTGTEPEGRFIEPDSMLSDAVVAAPEEISDRLLPIDVVTDRETGLLIQIRTARARAVGVLGLTYEEANDLFDGDNNLRTLRGKVQTLISEERIRRARAAAAASAKNESENVLWPR